MFRIIIFVVISLTFLSDRRGRPIGNAGAPGEVDNVTCLNCHIRGNFKPEIQIDLVDKANKKVQKILPNTDYTVNIQLIDSKIKASVYGFQLVPLTSKELMAGSFPTIGSRVKRVVDLNRTYISHNNRSTSATFTATWKSPNQLSDKDSIKFYYAGVVGNDDDNSIGDNAIVKSKTFLYESTTSNEAIEIEAKPILLTNITSTYLDFKYDKTISAVKVFNHLGYLIMEVEDTDLKRIDISSLSANTYFVQTLAEGKIYTQKFLKI